MFSFLIRFFSKASSAVPSPSAAHLKQEALASMSAKELKQRGNVFLSQDKFDLALRSYRDAAAIDEADSGVHIALGHVLMQMGRDTEAVSHLSRALELDRSNADGHYMLGLISKARQQTNAAIDHYRQALLINPGFDIIYTDLCQLLAGLGRVVEAQRLIEQGLVLFPAKVDLHYYLGNLYILQSKQQQAIDCFRHALKLQPAYAEVIMNLGHALRTQGDLDEALASYRTALSLQPDSVDAFSNLLLTLLYSSVVTSAEKFLEHQEFGRRFETPLKPLWKAHTNVRDPVKRLKIGYVSADLCDHTAAYLIEPVLANHDRSQIELFCYYNNIRHDEITDRFVAIADHWIPCSHLSDEQLAKRIREDGIDILVDLSGHTAGNRLLTFARKPAPVQATWLGYMATTGLTAVDYRITDWSIDPVGTTEQYHTETLVRLPSMAQFQPSKESPAVNALPALNAAPFTFGCLNNLAKVTPEVVRLWSEILSALPHSRLMLGNVGDEATRQKLTALFSNEGVPADRLLLQPKVSLTDYLALHHQIDLALDTFPYNGGTTTFHSLWMGVPVLALRGDTPISRSGAAIMEGAGHPEFVTDTPREYVQRAIECAGDLPRLNGIRQALRGHATSLFGNDPAYVARPLEVLYRTMWTSWCTHTA